MQTLKPRGNNDKEECVMCLLVPKTLRKLQLVLAGLQIYLQEVINKDAL
jgi:hypothetical protein